MSATLLGVFSGTNTSNTGILTVTSTINVPVGGKLIVASNRATTTFRNGAVITDSHGNTYAQEAYSCRSSTFDLEIHDFTLTTALSIGDVITITYANANTRKSALIAGWTGLGSTLATSGNTTPGLGNVNAGGQGSSVNPSVSTLSAAAGLLIGAHSIAAANVPSVGTGFTLIGSVETSAGSSDRGLLMQYKEVPVSGIQTSSVVMASGSYAAAAIVIDIPAPPPPTGPVITMISGGVEVPVVSTLISGGIEVSAVCELN